MTSSEAFHVAQGAKRAGKLRRFEQRTRPASSSQPFPSVSRDPRSAGNAGVIGAIGIIACMAASFSVPVPVSCRSGHDRFWPGRSRSRSACVIHQCARALLHKTVSPNRAHAPRRWAIHGLSELLLRLRETLPNARLAQARAHRSRADDQCSICAPVQVDVASQKGQHGRKLAAGVGHLNRVP